MECRNATYALRGPAQGGTFKAGVAPVNRVPVGTVRIRTRHKRAGVQRAFVKVADPNVWRERAQVVYEQAHGPRTRGKVIHHINGDPLDDQPENLVELTRAEHAAVHALHPSGRGAHDSLTSTSAVE